MANVVFAEYLDAPIDVSWSVPHLREAEAPEAMTNKDIDGE